jgi:hypothetical protein
MGQLQTVICFKVILMNPRILVVDDHEVGNPVESERDSDLKLNTIPF